MQNESQDLYAFCTGCGAISVHVDIWREKNRHSGEQKRGFIYPEICAQGFRQVIDR